MCAAATLLLVPAPARAQLAISVSFGPPAIPYYTQPPCPTPNYVWSPGYWAYEDGGGYYWVPGTWVAAPAVGLNWTPGYWGWNDGSYGWNQGYWAPQVGYYGGINYGYGYSGRGYDGGGWQGSQYRYNTAVTNVNRNDIRNVYADRTAAAGQWDRRSYNGGPGGVTARPTQSELAVARGRRVNATSVQTQHARFAAANRQSYATINHGRPTLAAVARPYSSTNRPVGAKPLTSKDRTTAAQMQRVHATAATRSAKGVTASHVAAKHAAPGHAAAVHTAAVHKAAVHTTAVHAATVHTAAVHKAAVHTAAVHAAPVHPAAVHAAAVQPAVVHAAPHAAAPHAAAPHAAPDAGAKPEGHPH
jgi:hypothetical protein